MGVCLSLGQYGFLTGGVFECEIAHRRSLAVLFMLYKIRCNPRCALFMRALYLTVRASAGYTRYSGRTSAHLCAASLQNLAVPQKFSGTILLTPYSMVGAGRFQVQGHCFLNDS